MSKHLIQHPVNKLELAQAHIEISLLLNIRTYEWLLTGIFHYSPWTHVQ